MKINSTVIIKGAGDLASGVAHRLWMSGFKLLMLELPEPLVVRRTVAFASAVFDGEVILEGVKARICSETDQLENYWNEGVIPLFVDPLGTMIERVSPHVLIDAVMAKRNTGTSCNDAPVVIGLGPGFYAGRDVHAVIETKRGHDLGRAIYSGAAEADTGVPGEIGGFSAQRLLRAPSAGTVLPLVKIGELVRQGQTVANIEGKPVIAEISGVVRGMIYPGLAVKKGTKIGDIDPRGQGVDCHTVSDKARAVAGGVLEAILRLGFS
jgi:xanthine dehydrogenase accessory factor